LLKLRSFLLLLCVLYVLLLLPTPYAVYEPGLAASVRPMVETKGGEADAEGDLLLTTVKLTYKTNLVQWIVALFNPHAELYRSADLFPDGDREAYARRQEFSMRQSQSEAIMAAYERLGIPYRLEAVGVVAAAVEPGAPADGRVEPGDWIVAVDGRPIRRLDDLREQLQAGRSGETKRVKLRRGQAEFEVELAPAKAGEDDRPAAQFGIAAVEMRDVVPQDPAAEVTIAAGDIGGPSAGLVFALEIVRRLGQPGLARGYAVAGTGTIARDGTVGAVGGIGHKVVAAHRSGADLFLCPAANGEEAAAKARAIGTSMRIVSVDSLQAAIDALAALPVKP
jgi:PDZ domain-containing protein